MMLDRILPAADRPQRHRECGPGTHVGTRLENAPEVAGILRKRPRAEGALTGGDTLLEELACLLDVRGRLLGEKQVRVGAVGRDRQCLARERRPPRALRLERRVHQVLRLEQLPVRGVVRSSPTDYRKHPLHQARVGQRDVRRSLGRRNPRLLLPRHSCTFAAPPRRRQVEKPHRAEIRCSSVRSPPLTPTKPACPVGASEGPRWAPGPCHVCQGLLTTPQATRAPASPVASVAASGPPDAYRDGM